MASVPIITGNPRSLSPTSIVIAAANDSGRFRRSADRICSASNARAVIQEYLDRGQPVELVGGIVSGGTYSPGLFTIDGPLELTYPGPRLIGQGIDAQRIALADGVNDFAIKVAPPTGETWMWGATVGGFTIDGNMNEQSAGGGIQMDRCYKGRLFDMRVLNTKAYAIRLCRLGGGASDFSAYNLLDNISCAVGLGNGIVMDASSEINTLRDCNASFFAEGVGNTNYYDPSYETSGDQAVGVGLLNLGGHLNVYNGHFDRNRVGIAMRFSHGNVYDTRVDNSWDCAVSLEGSHENTFRVGVGRCDPSVGGSGTNDLYGTRRAVNLTGDSSGNFFEDVKFFSDNSPGTIPAGAGRGAWFQHIGGSSGEGKSSHTWDGTTYYMGRNLLGNISPQSVVVRFDGASAMVKVFTSSGGTPNLQLLPYDLGPTGGMNEAIYEVIATAAASQLTLPDLGTVRTMAYRGIVIKNVGTTNDVTITPSSGDTLVSASTAGNITLTPGQWAKIVGPQSIAATPQQWQRIG